VGGVGGGGEGGGGGLGEEEHTTLLSSFPSSREKTYPPLDEGREKESRQSGTSHPMLVYKGGKQNSVLVVALRKGGSGTFSSLGGRRKKRKKGLWGPTNTEGFKGSSQPNTRGKDI